MAGGRKEVAPETRRVFTRLMAQAVALGFGNVVERVRGKSEQDGPEEWTTMDPNAGVKENVKTEAAADTESEPKTLLDKTDEV